MHVSLWRPTNRSTVCIDQMLKLCWSHFFPFWFWWIVYIHWQSRACVTIAILIRLTFNPLHLPLHLPNANAIPHSLNRNVSIKILFKLKVELVLNVFCILLSFKFNLFIIKNKSARLFIRFSWLSCVV